MTNGIVVKTLASAAVAFTFALASCGVGGGGSSSTDSSVFDSLSGTWSVRFYGDTTTCSGGPYADETFEDTYSTSTVGGVKHVAITRPAVDNISVDYTVTSDGSPLKMQRSWTVTSDDGRCTWNGTKSYELSSAGAGKLTGTWTSTDDSANPASCGLCYHSSKLEATKK